MLPKSSTFQVQTLSLLLWVSTAFKEQARLFASAAGIGGSAEEIVVNEKDLNDYVGQPPFTSDRIYEITPPGVVMGLAWSSQGGNALYVEAASVEKRENGGSLKTTTGEQNPFLCTFTHGRGPLSKSTVDLLEGTANTMWLHERAALLCLYSRVRLALDAVPDWLA